MKITTIECTTAEYIELKKSEKETEINITIGKIKTDKTVADLMKQTEFLRQQKECGRVNF